MYFLLISKVGVSICANPPPVQRKGVTTGTKTGERTYIFTNLRKNIVKLNAARPR